MKHRVLVVDDDIQLCKLLEEGLGMDGIDVVTANSAEQALERVGVQPFDAVLTDLNLGGTNGLALCQQLHALDENLPVVVITAFGSLDTAVAAIRVGAYDFVTKPFEMEALSLTVQRAVNLRSLKRELADLRLRVSQLEPIPGIVGESATMKRLNAQIESFAQSEASVLVRGETGSGKELVARAIHERSRRAEGPFVAVNVASLPPSLVEAELFGHARGAFTGATNRRQGLFVRANGGTLLLDEIGELPLELQPKLLRVLESRVVRPVGSDEEVPIDVRVIAATHRDLEGMIEANTFREDLFFRLSVLEVEVPPLRARGRDILLLAQHFLEHLAKDVGKDVRGIATTTATRLLDYPWPGNVRELRDTIERAVALATGPEIQVADLPSRVRDYQRSHVLVVSDDPSELVPLEVVEQRYIQRVLEAVGGNKTLAARILRLGRKTLYRKLERWAAGESDSTESE